ncbi:hypothetical protein JNJ66_06775 [Candidatus Saccharibacteria bacterium]|nr:hypothetical protein [Candidatus Saccharibacteria bacterium]
MSPEKFTEIVKNNKKGIFIGLAVFLVLFIGLPLTLDSLKDRTPGRVAAYQARLQGIADLADDQDRWINDERLENENTNMKVLLGGSATQIGSYIASRWGKADPEGARVAAQAKTLAEIETSLQESRLSNTYERTYRELMTMELASMYEEATVLSTKTGAKGKELFSGISEQIEAAYKGFVALDETPAEEPAEEDAAQESGTER